MTAWEGYSDSSRVMNKDKTLWLIKMSDIFFFIVTSRDRCNSEPHGVNGKECSRKTQLPWWKKILEFYKSPTAKFWANAVSC